MILPCSKAGTLPRQARRALVLTLGAACLAPKVLRAQAPPRVYRVGYIQTATVEEQAQLTRAFEDAMRNLGYAEAHNVVYERRFASGRQERLPELAEDLAQHEVDVIVTGGNPVIAAVKRATATIPIVMATSRDPVGSGFVASLAHPGGNITGLTGDPTPEVQAKRLELLKEVLPGIARVAALWNPLPPGAARYRNALESAARRLHVGLWVVEARGRDEFDGAFAAMARERADALVVIPDPVFFTARKQVVALAARYRLPAVYHASEIVVIGGLMSYGASLADQFRRAAVYVDRILKGAKPGDLAVEQATTLELAINLTTARTLGLTVPGDVLLRADQLIE